MAFLYFDDVQPMRVQSVADRERILDAYAEQFANQGHCHCSIDEFVDQAAADMKDGSIKSLLKAKIRRLRLV